MHNIPKCAVSIYCVGKQFSLCITIDFDFNCGCAFFAFEWQLRNEYVKMEIEWNTRPIVWDVPLLIWSLHFARRFIYFISFVCSLCAHGNNLNELVLSSLRELYWGGCIFMVPCQMYLTVLLFIVWLLDEHFGENVLRAHVFRFGVGLHSPSFSSGLSIILSCTGNNNRATTNKIYNICMLVLK